MKAPASFDERVAERVDGMSPAEQRVARFFLENREEVLIASAAVLAKKAKTSDATVVRATKALGFSGLDDLRRTLVTELRGALSPADRLTRTLGEIGDDLYSAFQTTLTIQLQSLEELRATISEPLFRQSVESILGSRRVVVFGLGPSSAIAEYFVVQLNRFGFDAAALSNTGLLFADDLRKLRPGDCVVMLAYGRIYAELAALLDEIERLSLRSVLMTDTLAGSLKNRVGTVLSVARGRAEMLSLHTATLGLVEALLTGIASQRPAETVASLRQLNEARRKLAGEPARLGNPRSLG